MILGCLLVYSLLFAVGNWIYGDFVPATVMTLLAIGSGLQLSKIWKKMGKNMI
jgi:hypothetical protein